VITVGKKRRSASKGSVASPSKKREAKEARQKRERKQRLVIAIVIVAVIAVSAFAILNRDDPSPGTTPPDGDSGDDTIYGPYGRLIDGNPTIMDIGSTSCIPCQQLQPVLDALGQKYDGEINFLFYDCWNTAEGADMANAYQLTVIPTLVFLDGNGHEVDRLMGYNSQEQIEAKMSELGWI